MAGHGPWMLYTWGAIPFETYPLNIDTIQHVTATDWARKEIAGAAVYREWVGENDEELHFRGKVFPKYFVNIARQHRVGIELDDPQGGLGHLDVMDNMRRLGQAHALVRADGWHLGWFVIERLTRAHAHLASGPNRAPLNGVGQQIDFEVSFQRVPVPNDPAAYFPAFWGQVGA